MNTPGRARDRRTSVSQIFDYLFEEISAMRLRPGDKISESEIATRFGVSRQPVRDAFSRLENLELLSIRPQRATEVKRFSMHEIKKSRFVRCAVESEVLRRASVRCNAPQRKQLQDCLSQQCEARDAGDYDNFGQLDYQFHKLICAIAEADFAFDIIAQEKAKVDRLCMLSLSKEKRMPLLVDDHQNIASALSRGDAEAAVTAGVLHLSRLDGTIDAIVQTNSNYFES